MLISVKDKENLLPFNVWSGTEYLKNTNGFTASNLTMDSSKEWSSNGDYSLQVTTLINNYARVEFIDNIPALKDETYVGSVDIFNNSNNNIILRFVENTNILVQDIIIPSSNSMQTISITRTIISDSTNLRFQLVFRNAMTIYVDNISLIRVS